MNFGSHRRLARVLCALGLVLLMFACTALVMADPLHPPRTGAAPPGDPTVPTTCGGTIVTENSSSTIELGLSIACIQNDTNFYHYDNSFWRAFYLPDFGITGTFDICQVDFGIDHTVSGSGTGQPATINLYTSDAPFPGGTLTLIGSLGPIPIPDMSDSMGFMPLSAVVAPGSEVVLEVHIPDGVASHDVFFLGANSQSESAPSYISASTGDCGIPTPVTLASLGLPNVHWIMRLEGNEVRPASPLRVDEHTNPNTVSNGNGVFEIGETVQVEPSFENPGTLAYSLTGNASSFTGPGSLGYAIVDGAADYGAIAPSASNNCFDATGDCYLLQVPAGARPQQHLDLQLAETGSAATTTPAGIPAPPIHTWTLHVGESFADVPTSNIFYPYIENVFHNGVTAGCDTANYCPTGTTLRKQMAVFVLKAKEGPAYVPPAAVGIFNDVPPDDPFAPWIEELHNRGVVAGCSAPGGPNYCPDDPVLRQQMAVFLLRTLLGSGYTPPACATVFVDVACPGLFTDWIEDVYNRGITAGCSASPLQYCPTASVTRGQMGPFLVRTFGLLLYGP